MIEGQDIICFSNDWDSDPLSKKHIMQRLAKKNRVLWINSIGNRKPTASVHDLKRVIKKLRDFAKGSKSVGERIHVYSPISWELPGALDQSKSSPLERSPSLPPAAFRKSGDLDV